jgi:hypothetical protein
MFPKLYSMSVYRMVDNPYQVPYLSKLDAEILGVDLNLENQITIDIYRYNSDIKEIYTEILNKAKAELEILKSKEDQDSESTSNQNSLVDRIEEIEEKTWVEWEEDEE